jgi:uncharacterized protein YkwD
VAVNDDADADADEEDAHAHAAADGTGGGAPDAQPPVPGRPPGRVPTGSAPSLPRPAPARSADPQGFAAVVNAERTRAGAPAVVLDDRLAEAASRHAAAMAAGGALAVETSDGVSVHQRVGRAGFSCLALTEQLVSGPRDAAGLLAYCVSGAWHPGIGENIACGQRSAAEVVEGWMNSPGHRANILKPDFTHIGVGYATGGRAGTYWTQLFGAAD